MITFYLFLLSFFLEATTVLKRENVFFLYLLLPGLYFLEAQLSQKKILFPKKISFIYSLFIVILLISFCFSIDKINSFDHLLYYFSAYFVFIFALNEKEKILPQFKAALITFGFFSSLISLLPKNLFPPTAYQLVFPFYGNHNHLGDFLGIVILWLIYDFLTKRQAINLYLTLFFLPFFLFAHSRSAYLDLFLVGGSMVISFKIRKKPVFEFAGFIFILVLIFFIFSQKQTFQASFLKPFLPAAERYLKTQPRDLWSGRAEYFSQAIRGFLEKPLFGWGIGNFTYPSNKYVTDNLQQVSSALNLPLTILTEVGIFGFLAFLGFVLNIYLNRDPKEKIIFYLFLYLGLNFLTNYTYSLYGVYLFWFFLAGLLYKKKDREEFFFYPLFSLVVLFLLFLRLTAEILNLTGNFYWSLKLFPFTHKGYQGLISQEFFQGEKNSAENLAEKYYRFSSASFSTLDFLADFNQVEGNLKQALIYRLELLKNYHYPPLAALKKTYLLKKDVEGKKQADQYFMSFFDRLEENFWRSSIFKDEVWRFCGQENIVGCRFYYFYEPDPKSHEKILKQVPYQENYTINKDTLNDRFNYSIEKPKDVFRVVILGDSLTFGLLVKTKDNWTEKLEDLLNKRLIDANIKKIEVINLAVHGYDIPYEVERFRKRGIKYQPDLVIWSLSSGNFYQFNEVMLGKTRLYKEEMKKSGELNTAIKKEDYYPSWEKSYKETLSELGGEKILDQIKKYLNEFNHYYRGPLLIITSPDISNKETSLLSKTVNRPAGLFLRQVKELSDSNFYFPKTGQLNKEGHQLLAERVFSYLIDNRLVLCRRCR